MASPMDEAMFSVAANAPRRCATRTDFFFIASVSARKSFAILSSMTSVLMVLAPVMPSLKSLVILEFSSRTSRLTRMSLP